ncbi:PEP-CTERM sorting domain-containing protein [Duganella sp. FT135W]|uniref:PEP-CTERM sorting domain-containing protein n=1 Tax=Duganella flavida TaxID=2692175 RepID=A0A6L8KGI4_9BURK|nr:FxDxF family PEP-CTERM protein [Duganella flavida]MYM24964.1 PEP-CTERM sorting domain-containing protein [Duganella flavida]
MVGFSAANVGISGNVASVNWNGLSFTTDTRVVLNISAVPEPATYGMLMVGLGLLGVAARRRQS